MAKLIDGKGLAAQIRNQISEEVQRLMDRNGIKPKLSVVLVGDDPASKIYVKNKERAAAEAGISTETLLFPSTIKQESVVDAIVRLNKTNDVDGILVQLPLPKNLNEAVVLESISYEKDVDGIHPYNMGLLLKGQNPRFTSCTPQGVLELILSTGVPIEGKEAVVIGRSNIVGKPTSVLLLQSNATVTICHSKTANLGNIVRRGDIVVAAIGRPKFIQGDMIKEGAIVIDVGMNRTAAGLFGDVDFVEAGKRASYITPVPGGVGPMTIAMLLKNTLKAAKLRGTKQSPKIIKGNQRH